LCGWGVTVSDRKRTHYDNLQVSRDASRAVIQAAYRALAQRYHPDKWPEGREAAERIMRIINEAYEVLSDPEKRREHDRWIDETFGADVEGNDSASSPPKTVRDTKGPLAPSLCGWCGSIGRKRKAKIHHRSRNDVLHTHITLMGSRQEPMQQRCHQHRQSCLH